MRKFLKRIIAAQVGILLAAALVSPVQALRLGDALCSNNPDGIYEFVQNTGFTREEVADIAAQTDFYRDIGFMTCDGYSIRGAWVTSEGSLSMIVKVGDSLYLFEFGALGDLLSIE